MKNRVIFVTLFLTAWITPPVHALTVQKTCTIEASGEGCIFDLNATGAGTLQICTKAGRVGDRWRATAVQVNTTGASSAVGNGSTGTFTGCASRSVTNGVSYEVLGTWERPLPGTFPATVTVQISGPFASVAGPRPLSFVEGGQGCPADGSVISCGALFKCRFDSTADIDVFKFAGSANGAVSIKITGPSNSLWTLFRSTGNVVATGKGEATLPLTGDYTVQTSNTNNTIGDYWLSLEGISQAFQCGTPIAFGNVKNGNFDAPADTDTFQFVGLVNQVVSIKITGPSASLWQLFGPTGNFVATGVATATGQGTLSASGTHTIQVSNANSLTGAYTLSLQKVGGP